MIISGWSQTVHHIITYLSRDVGYPLIRLQLRTHYTTALYTTGAIMGYFNLTLCELKAPNRHCRWQVLSAVGKIVSAVSDNE